MNKYTIIARSLDAGPPVTGYHFVLAEDDGAAETNWLAEYPNTEIVGVFAGHIEPLRWEV